MANKAVAHLTLPPSPAVLPSVPATCPFIVVSEEPEPWWPRLPPLPHLEGSSPRQQDGSVSPKFWLTCYLLSTAPPCLRLCPPPGPARRVPPATAALHTSSFAVSALPRLCLSGPTGTKAPGQYKCVFAAVPAAPKRASYTVGAGSCAVLWPREREGL